MPRTTVQHYVPSKDILATEIMNSVADIAFSKAKEITEGDPRSSARFFVVGQISHGMHYSTPGMRQFMFDIASDKNLQHAVSLDYTEWTIRNAGFTPEDIDPSLIDCVLFANGGAFEIHCVCIKEGRNPDIATINRETFRPTARLMGITRDEYEDITERYSMSNEELLKIGAELVAQLSL